jgi:hypothetical protein
MASAANGSAVKVEATATSRRFKGRCGFEGGTERVSPSSFVQMSGYGPEKEVTGNLEGNQGNTSE